MPRRNRPPHPHARAHRTRYGPRRLRRHPPRPAACFSPGSLHSDLSARESLFRAILASLPIPPERYSAYLAFTRQLYLSLRQHPPIPLTFTRPLDHLTTRPLPGRLDFARHTKRLVQGWFRRGLSGHLLWKIGEQLLLRLCPTGPFPALRQNR
jgi:hypothetical protein